MSSRSSPSSHRRHSRDTFDDFPPLPPPPNPRDAPLRASLRDRNSNSLPHSRHNSAFRRAERIRNLDNSIISEERFGDSYRQEEVWSGSRLERIRGGDLSRGSNLEDLDRTLEEANSHLRALLDLHSTSITPPLMPPSYSPPVRSQDLSDDNRRHKRRKLDSDRMVSSFKAFRYGTYGQVEPGDLRMEMVSCDGGMFSNDSSYPAENILKNDTSVYCTKGNRCNIVLRHQGGTVFTLQELVIKAPLSMAYSHPVREGMVFIAMNEDDKLNRTAHYQIQYSKNRNGSSDDSSDNTLQPLEPTEIVSIRHTDSRSSSGRRAYVYRPIPDDSDSRTPLMPREFTANVPDFNITTECSDAEDDDGAPDPYDIPRRAADPGVRRLHPIRNHIGSLPFESLDSDSDDNPFGAEAYFGEHERNWRAYNASHNPSARRPVPSASTAATATASSQTPRPSVTLAEAWEAHVSATQEAVSAVGGEMLRPHARFFIEKKKSKCTIRFDPPVSGRFILLKMWSSHHDPSSNIDIQSVMARGYAGPRYFPSVELR